MSTNGRRRSRLSRVLPLERPPGDISRIWDYLHQLDVLARLGLGLMAALAMCAATRAWAPPFEFRAGDVPLRDVTARTSIQVPLLGGSEEDGARFATVSAGDVLVRAGQALAEHQVALLRLEHEAYVRQLPAGIILNRTLAVVGLLLALQVFCGYYIARREPRLLQPRRLAAALALSTVTILLATWASHDPWRAELIPFLLFGMTIAIAYHRELAMIMTGSLALVQAAASGHSLSEFIVLTSVVVTGVVQLRRIRSRRKLIQVGVLTGAVAFLVSLAVGLLDGLGFSNSLWVYAGRNALWTVLAGFLMTGLLPFIEGLFGVLTEISLLELGDVAHPLLQELVRRAPGTYNHSINVASIAESAAESVGGQGLLVRVGAYFHDIGKMLKPDYFVENQGTEGSRHDTLVPAMSTLIIIAHIKDGADLARQHHLPLSIIDFIEQHHGTTLVEYFYRRANEQHDQNPDTADVEESSFRYPGPKPQTLEAAVLMLADAVESASRTLVEPTPARIEGLVENIAMKKLLDGQFDECGLTLMHLRTIEDSLIKSLTAVYHGRVKYPDQRTA